MHFASILVIGFCCSIASARADVSHVVHSEQHVTAHSGANPYIFSYSAGRAPGHTDHQHTEVSDGSGVIRGVFSYVDPKNQVRTVQYVADKNGFHPQLSHQNEDSPAVKLEKQKHLQLYNRIAQEHAAQGHQQQYVQAGVRAGAVAQAQAHAGGHTNNAAVVKATHKHLANFQKIAAQHAAIGAQQEAQRKHIKAHSAYSAYASGADGDDGQYHPERYQNEEDDGQYRPEKYQ